MQPRELITLPRLITFAEGIPNAEGILDDLVHDEKSWEASSINNDGVESQVRYLEPILGVNDLLERLQDWMAS